MSRRSDYDEFFGGKASRSSRKIGQRSDGKGLLLNDAKPAKVRDKAEAVKIMSEMQEHFEKKTVRAKPQRAKKVKEKPAEGEVITLSSADKRDQYQAVVDFFASIGGGETPIMVGIDPGVSGGIGLIHPTNPGLTTALDIPTITVQLQKKSRKGKAQKRTKFNHAEIWRWFDIIREWRHRVVVCLEKTQAMKTDSPLTAYSMGTSYAMWPLFLLSHGFVLEEREPQEWKRKLGLWGKDKEFSRMMAQRLWPLAPLFNKGHHDRAEALLLAEQVRRERQGQ